MKTAIIGSGAAALETACYFKDLGAQVTLFHKNEFGGKLKFTNDPEVFDHYKNLIEQLKDFSISVKEIRVQKKFLDKSELAPEGKSRFYDLFRVIYKGTPHEEDGLSILDKSKYEELSRGNIEELTEPLEQFSDFDIIVDATGEFSIPLRGGVSGDYALNEARAAKKEKVKYGHDLLEVISNLDSYKDLVLIGCSHFTKPLLQKAFTRLNNGELSVKIVFTEKALPNFIEETIGKLESEYQKKRDQFYKDMDEWKSLENYIRAKKKAPIEPRPSLELIRDYKVFSVDTLSDKEQVFVTLEKSPYIQDQNEELKTINTDLLLVDRGFKRNTEHLRSLNVQWDCVHGYHSAESIAANETGLFILGRNKSFRSPWNLVSIKEQIQELDNLVRQLFSRG